VIGHRNSQTRSASGNWPDLANSIGALDKRSAAFHPSNRHLAARKIADDDCRIVSAIFPKGVCVDSHHHSCQIAPLLSTPPMNHCSSPAVGAEASTKIVLSNGTTTTSSGTLY
jgi:hypothetical protein